MKKILFVINTMDRAGAEMALLELLKNFPKEDYQLSLFVLTGQGKLASSLPANVQLLNKEYDMCSVHSKEGRSLLLKKIFKSLFIKGNIIKLFPYLVKNTCRMVKNKRFLPEKIMWRVLADGAEVFDNTYDLAVAYIEGGAAYYVAKHVKAKRKIAFLHIDFNLAGYSRMLDEDCYLQFDKVYAISQEVRDTFENVYPECKSKTELFNNIINREEIIKLAKQGEGFKDNYSGVRILTLGRLTSQKNFAVSIEAMKLLKNKGIEARWYILGEGKERKQLEGLIKKYQLENCFFLPGAVSNPFPYLEMADIYVHATSYEGISIAVREAQILGKAMVVSDCNGNRELVRDGIDGFVCSFTPEAIAEGVFKLIENKELRATFGQEASKRYVQHMDEIEKYVLILQEG